MAPWEGMLGFAAVSFALAISPGPSWAFVLSVATTSAPRTAAAILGNALGIVAHVILAATGLAAALNYSTLLFTVFQWLGAAYLVGLGVSMILRRSPRAPGKANRPQPPRRSFSR